MSSPAILETPLAGRPAWLIGESQAGAIDAGHRIQLPQHSPLLFVQTGGSALWPRGYLAGVPNNSRPELFVLLARRWSSYSFINDLFHGAPSYLTFDGRVVYAIDRPPVEVAMGLEFELTRLP